MWLGLDNLNQSNVSIFEARWDVGGRELHELVHLSALLY
jgi:hypothetical protein